MPCHLTLTLATNIFLSVIFLFSLRGERATFLLFFQSLIMEWLRVWKRCWQTWKELSLPPLWWEFLCRRTASFSRVTSNMLQFSRQVVKEFFEKSLPYRLSNYFYGFLFHFQILLCIAMLRILLPLVTSMNTPVDQKQWGLQSFWMSYLY